MVPSSRATSTSTVGFPRESRISRAPTASMLGTGVSLATLGQAAHLPRVAASGAPCRADELRSLDRALLRLGVELAGVAADRLAQRVLDVPAALLGGGDDGQQPLPQLLGAGRAEVCGRGREGPAAAPPAPGGWPSRALRVRAW